VNGWWVSDEQKAEVKMDILTFPGCNSIGLTPALLYDLYHPELAPGLDKVINK